MTQMSPTAMIRCKCQVAPFSLQFSFLRCLAPQLKHRQVPHRQCPSKKPALTLIFFTISEGQPFL